MPPASSSLGYDELIVGTASGAGSLVIILTYLFFPNLRKLRYVELVFYVAINDLFASVGLALGPVPNDSAECWFQGLSSNINYVSSAFWTSVILYQVFLVVVKNGKVLQNMLWIHIFCWGWPVVVALLPLTTNTYNNPDDESTWCFVANTRRSPPWAELFWVLLSFFIWIWLCMLVNCVQIVIILRKLRNMQVVNSVVLSTTNKLIFYPLITIISWSLNTMTNLYVFTTGTTYQSLSPFWDTIGTIGVILAAAQGVFNAMVFICMNTIVREHWAELFHRIYRLVFFCSIEKARDIKTASYMGEINVNVISPIQSSGDAANQPSPSQGSKSIAQMGDAFRDTTVGDVQLSSYLSVSLPVEDELDFVGNNSSLWNGDVENVENDKNSMVGGFDKFRMSHSTGAASDPAQGGMGRNGSFFDFFRNSTGNFGSQQGSSNARSSMFSDKNHILNKNNFDNFDTSGPVDAEL